MVEILLKGTWCVFIWFEDGHIQVLDFLESLEKSADPDAGKLQHLIEQCADNGPMSIRNETKCKHLEDGIYEFKASGGSRIFWFFDEQLRKVIVCTHGVNKPSGRGKKPYKAELKKAKTIRKSYLEEKQRGDDAT